MATSGRHVKLTITTMEFEALVSHFLSLSVKCLFKCLAHFCSFVFFFWFVGVLFFFLYIANTRCQLTVQAPLVWDFACVWWVGRWCPLNVKRVLTLQCPWHLTASQQAMTMNFLSSPEMGELQGSCPLTPLSSCDIGSRLCPGSANVTVPFFCGHSSRSCSHLGPSL
jgi:hypothetical protein